MYINIKDLKFLDLLDNISKFKGDIYLKTENNDKYYLNGTLAIFVVKSKYFQNELKNAKVILNNEEDKKIITEYLEKSS